MWDDRYDKEEYVYGTTANDFLQAQYQHIPAGGRVLCIAEGEGRNAVFLAQKGYEVVAVDASKVGLGKAQKLAEDKGVEITTQVADLADYDFGEDKWDGVVSIWAHTPKELRQEIHHEVINALKPKGVFILEAYNPEQLDMPGVGGPPANQLERFVTLNNLQNELSDLNVIECNEKHRDVHEGEGHDGLSAVVQYVGIKP